MELIATRRFDDVLRGERIERPEYQARELISKGLAKVALPALNKMAPMHEGKANAPGALSSASPAGPASMQTMSKPSGSGGKRRKAKGAPSS